ncbi:MAG: hypothetical protein HGB11_10340 [Chlorobiales bacterium]|nr:hypothetical protein [Chlorobiales bacterium]
MTSEKKIKLMIYRSQIERELAQLNAILSEHDDILPEAIEGNLYRLHDEYIEALQKTRGLSVNFRLAILEKLRQLE